MDWVKRSGFGGVLCLAAAWCGVAHAAALDTLIQQLGGEDESARAVARQMLPRESIEAVPKLLPLVVQDNAAVWCAAFQVLSDFANAVSAPGREAERQAVTGYLMALVAPDQPQAVKERGLRLLPLVTPEGYDVGSVAALLSDPDPILREKARAALQEIGTTQAAAALAAALPAADADFKCALLNALGSIKNENSLPAVLQHTRDGNPQVRATAARAAAWTGNPAYLTELRGVRAAATPETSFDATDALLRLADAMGLQGGNWDAVLGIYREVLNTVADPVQKSGAIAGLGRFGDETVVLPILSALKGENGRELEPAALAAFDSMQGAAVAYALLDAYPTVSDDMRLSLIHLFGRRGHPASLELLNETARSDNPVFRQAALNALIDTRLPEVLPSLVAAVQEGTPEDKALAITGLRQLGPVWRNAGHREAAGKAFLALYQASDTEETKQEALEGIKQCPVPEAFDVVLADISPEEMGELPVSMVAGIAKAMADAGRGADADRLIESLLPRINTTGGIRDALQFLGSMKGDSALACRLGLVSKWRLVGPFPFSMPQGFPTYINEPNVDLNATYTIDDKPVTWMVYESPDASGIVDLMSIFGIRDHVCAYAYTEITVSEETEAVVRMGSDDGIKAWVNGEVIHENNVDRGTLLDQDQAPAKFRTGKNTILVQISQNAGGWDFCLRLTKPDGTVLPFTMISE